MLLAGDIGGTKTELAIYEADGSVRAPLQQATFPSARYLTLEDVVRAFLSTVRARPTAACFGVAGPVVGGRARVTNLSWEMEEQELAAALGMESVTLLNDLRAIASAVPLLDAVHLAPLNAPPPVPGGAIAVIAPGTGLGAAYLTWTGTCYQAHPSEGGHASFAPSGELQIGLLRYLSDIYGHVSWERVCSGIGIPGIYAYLKTSGYASEPTWLADRLAAARDATPVIVSGALDAADRCELCAATLDTFVSILGAAAGDQALNSLATGGVYVGGGIPPRILPALRSGQFMHAFADKGRFSEFMLRLPVHVILHPNAALLGAAAHGLRVCAGGVVTGRAQSAPPPGKD